MIERANRTLDYPFLCGESTPYPPTLNGRKSALYLHLDHSMKNTTAPIGKPCGGEPYEQVPSVNRTRSDSNRSYDT
jgi:hypothetical protein